MRLAVAARLAPGGPRLLGPLASLVGPRAGGDPAVAEARGAGVGGVGVAADDQTRAPPAIVGPTSSPAQISFISSSIASRRLPRPRSSTPLAS